jgi:hypothetical protein
MTAPDSFPYTCHDDAIEEYKSLRNEIIESQKQRINLLQYSIAFIAFLFGFFMRDGVLNSREALFLIALSIPPSLFSYSTRCRERRLANYIGIFLGQISPWSSLSTEPIKLKFFQRTSTTIILAMLLLDLVL